MHNDISIEAKFLAKAVPALNDIEVYPDLSLHFEYVTPNRELVIPHENSELVLIGAAENRTLTTLPYDRVIEIGKELGIRCAEEYSYSASNIDELENLVKQETDIEGVVVRFDDDKMLRIKTDYYCNRRFEKTGIPS